MVHLRASHPAAPPVKIYSVFRANTLQTNGLASPLYLLSAIVSFSSCHHLQPLPLFQLKRLFAPSSAANYLSPSATISNGLLLPLRNLYVMPSFVGMVQRGALDSRWESITMCLIRSLQRERSTASTGW